MTVISATPVPASRALRRGDRAWQRVVVGLLVPGRSSHSRPRYRRASGLTEPAPETSAAARARMGHGS